MAADLLIFVALGGLLVFILWESWRSRRAATGKRVGSPEGFVPGGAAREVGLFVLAAAFMIAGLLMLYAPELRTSMRQSQLFRWAESLLGPFTGVALFLAAAVAAFVVGLSVRAKRLENSRRGRAG
jgi:hypothetical protein